MLAIRAGRRPSPALLAPTLALSLVLMAFGCGSGASSGGGPADTGSSTPPLLDAVGDTVIPPRDTGNGGKPDATRVDGRADSGEDPIDVGGEDDTGGPGECAPPAEFLCPCETNGDCLDGWCILTLQGRVCSKTCISECPEGWQCRQNQNALPDLIYICVQPMTLVCRPCARDADCRSGFGESDDRCLDYGPDGRFCGTECGGTGGSGSTCPDGFVCSELALGDETVSQCTPESGDCECTPGFLGESTTCYVENGVGRCEGTRTCAADGLTDCDAPTPANEDCDGLDNDCDGLTDEVAELGTERCGQGACDHTVESCQGGQWVDCDPLEGAGAETCNGLDDDCDGLTDEEWGDKGRPCDGSDPGQCPTGRFVCRQDGTGLVCEDDDDASVESCNLADDDCDGLTDEVDDLGTTACGLGVCAHEEPNCRNGVPVICDPLAGAGAEQCNLLDDDCDGSTDEPIDLGQTTCGLGVCLHTIDNCRDGAPQTCDPLQGAGAELCNDRDDDCNGTTDDPWPEKYAACDGPDGDSCGRGQRVCADGGGGLVCEGDEPETLEQCNGEDDDCDGLTDEAEDLGATTCGLGICAHTASDCVNGEWLDCDPYEGAEASDDPDPLFLDSNCDGVDGDAALAVFVDHQDGHDLGDGTLMNPVKTLARAMQLADPTTRPHVYLSVGTYAGPLTLRPGISLYGGYNAAEGWARAAGNTVTISGPDRAVIGVDITAPTVLDSLTLVAQGNADPSGSVYTVFLVRSSAVRIRGCTIVAGDAGGGQGGPNGGNGANGDSGDSGDSGCEYGCCGLGCIPIIGCRSCAAVRGGAGGGNVCDGTTVSGGAGGDGGGNGNDGADGVVGRGTAPGAGGGGGNDTDDGSAGRPGNPGSAGGAGAQGASFGSLAEAGYQPSPGATGSTGTPGSGAGGGGGGGGNSECFFLVGCKVYGSGGGGGGAGGCGGAGGAGGFGGGASIGVYVWGGGPILEGNLVTTGRGGQGGAGGAPGGGGTGGGPGLGGPRGIDDRDHGLGATGGRGGDGGSGGAGGGGGGGPSLGVVCGGSASPLVTGNVITPGPGGPGGASAGNPGQTGVSQPTWGCP